MGECPYEQGGYFIVDGMEKIIVGHEKKAENKIYVQSVNDEQISHTIILFNLYLFIISGLINSDDNDFFLSIRDKVKQLGSFKSVLQLLHL